METFCGHILRLNEQCPANNAMKFYFEETNAKNYRGRPRTTIVTTLNNDIKRTVRKIQTFPVRVLNKVEDLVHDVSQLRTGMCGDIQLEMFITSPKMKSRIDL